MNKNNIKRSEYLEKYLGKVVSSTDHIFAISKKEDFKEFIGMVNKNENINSITVSVGLKKLKTIIRVLEDMEGFDYDYCNDMTVDIIVTEKRPVAISGTTLTITLANRWEPEREDIMKKIKEKKHENDRYIFRHIDSGVGEADKIMSEVGPLPLPELRESVNVEFIEDPVEKDVFGYTGVKEKSWVAKVYIFGEYKCAYNLIIDQDMYKQLVTEFGEPLKGLKDKIFVVAGIENHEASADKWTVERDFVPPKLILVKHRGDLEKLRDEGKKYTNC